MAVGDAPIVDIDRETGELIQGWPRCQQSIRVILTTRLRTRIMRLWWGSEFMNTLDKPNNSQTYNLSILAALNAINEYEPEFRADRVRLSGAAFDGQVTVIIQGVYLPDEEKKLVQVTLT